MLSISLILALLSPSLSAQDKPRSDERGQLTPFGWQGKAPEASAEVQTEKPKFKRVPTLSERAAKDDEVVCEQGVLHPTEARPGESPAAAFLGGAIGVQHCRKKSDPNTIIKRPVSNAQVLQEAMTQGMGPANSISGPGFKPLKKPNIRRKVKKTAKVKKD